MLGYGRVEDMFGLKCISFMDGLEVFLILQDYFFTVRGCFLLGYTFVEVFWFIFRPIVSFVVSIHSTKCGLHQYSKWLTS